MPNVLCISVRFLQPLPTFHGRSDAGEPEWPPSPLRLSQALVDAAASRWREPQFGGYAKPALEWLQQLAAPEVVAPDHSLGTPFRIAVPNNDLDVWAGPVSKGNEPKKQPNELKTMKQVRPTHLSGEAVHYLYPLPDGGCPHEEVLKAAARSITHLGWGIDMVAADATVIPQEEADMLPGHRWRPVSAGGTPLRVPKAGTLENLMAKHKAFLERLSSNGFRPVPPLSTFDVVGYHCATLPTKRPAAPRPFAAFEFLRPDAEGRKSFDPTRRIKDIDCMIRQLIGNAAGGLGLSNDDIRMRINGHDTAQTPIRGEQADQRLAFLPLPTINPKLNRVEAIRRLLILGVHGQQRLITEIQRRLAGELLSNGQIPVAMLTVLPRTDWVLKQYVLPARQWSTVSPVVLPGYDDRDPTKCEKLLRRAFQHAGVPQPSQISWRRVGFRAGAELVSRYVRPEHLTGPMYHVRVQFPQSVAGPLAIGAGRYRGFGLFAAES